ncbi:EAL domain-containing protein [uncultured Thiocystis sp.]|jgi:DNA-binding response OmpR family regulator/EAL domain-containing protein (putative c-di-GMP-specific phosphodiesterase class I)|uniref:EAL domain-containing protein n=1 Tax=uncultured Thiocystis sp. TaxID=1202134 RepID=UPI0025D1AB70|nr:EAL domain-containing protein [uncultured Thiocystis sp.]
MLTPRLRETDSVGRILFLTPDPGAADALQAELIRRSMRCESCATPTEAMARCAIEPPALLLFDTRLASKPEDLGPLAARIMASQPTAIVLAVLGHREDIRFRLAAMRAGAEVYLPLSLDTGELADHLARLIGARRMAPDKILVVDDQPVAALFASRILQGAGMITERVCDPLEVMQALDRFAPDLVLMDLYMPGASGIELTRIIREEDRFADLPIIFLSSELDPEQQIAALRIGGDDFLAKPVAPDRLVERVQQRLHRARERARRQQGPETIDRLTGLATRDRLLKRLDQLIGLTRPDPPPGDRRSANMRLTGPRCLVYLELAGGTEALERMAAVVAGRIEEGDLAARAGELAIAVLIRRDTHLALAEFAQTLTYQVGRALADDSLAADLGGGWYPLVGGCNDSVTLLSRAGKAARLALRRGDRDLGRYVGKDNSTEGLALQSAILLAIRASRIQLLFEPIVALTGAEGERYEVTPRVRLGDGELLAPADFAPLLVRANAGDDLDRWLLTASLNAMRDRLIAGKPVQLFIHQSFAIVAKEDWVDWVRDQINDRDLIRLRPILQLEVAEADAYLELASNRSSQLNRLGIRICLNGIDFSERSSRVLHAVPAHFARIGKQVVQGPEAESMTWLIQSAKASGAKVIATGVDGPEAVGRLFSAGVDLIQGPYVQPPTSIMDYDFIGAEAADPTSETA